MLHSIANEHMNYDLKCIECVHGLDVITRKIVLTFLLLGHMLYAMYGLLVEKNIP